MKRFLIKCVLFFLVILLIIGLSTSLYYFQIRNSLILPSQINTIILGDSHTQNGINDKKIDNSINLSSSAESYLYSYAKLKYLAVANPNIKFVILAFSKHNIDKSIDNLWLLDEQNVFSKFGSLFPVLTSEDFEFIIKYGSIKLGLKIVHGSIYHSLYSIERQILINEMPFIGGFTPNNGILSSVTYHNNNSSIEYSTLQLNYLKKISSLCFDNNINLLLVNTPVYNKSYRDTFDIQLLDQYDVKYLDFSDLKLDSIYFADMNHLNPQGADFLSSIINSELEALWN